MNTWGRLLAISSAAVSIVCFAVAVPAGAANLSRDRAPASPGSAAAPAGGTYVPVTPARILDTRVGVGAPTAPVAAGATLTVAVGGAGGVPATGVSAAVVNLTVTGSTNAGHVIVYPAGGSRPVVSDTSFQAGITRAHLVVTQLGTGGRVSLYNGSAGTIELIADVSGYYTSGPASAPGAFTPVTPARLVDTRVRLGAPIGPVGGRQTTVVTVLGHGGVPATGVSAVVLNVTVTAATGPGYVAIHHYATDVSAVNYQTGATASNLAIFPVDPIGHVKLLNNSGYAVQLVVDVFGYYASGAPHAAGLFGSDGPYRLLDTRSVDGSPGAPIPAGGTLTVAIAGLQGVPTDATAVALNVTVPGGPAPGYLSVYAAGTARLISSTVNFQSVAIANLTIAALGANGAVTIYNSSSEPANVVLDVDGYIAAVSSPLTWTSPHRIGTSGVSSVSCSSSTFCMAVNDATGGATTFNGSAWSDEVTTGATEGLDSVSCVSSAFCVAVGSGSSDVYRNGSWTDVPVSGGDPLRREVSCVSTTFCMEVDGDGAASTFNGASWGTPDQLISNGELQTLSCVSVTFCMAGGEPGDAGNATAKRPDKVALTRADLSSDSIFKWDGSRWGAATMVATGRLGSLNCVSTSFCLASSAQASVVYDGSDWSAPQNAGFLTTGCLSSSVCLGSGFAPAGAMSTFTVASGWAAGAELDSYGQFISISCATSSTICVALDDRSDVVVGT